MKAGGPIGKILTLRSGTLSVYSRDNKVALSVKTTRGSQEILALLPEDAEDLADALRWIANKLKKAKGTH